MEEIRKKYEIQRIIPSDINEHIQTLYNYGQECNHITEMGVRWVSSTWAFLYSKPNKLISYDIVRHENINEVEELSKKNELDFKFIEADVLKVEIEPTELLFIDTLHTYNQLIRELMLHGEKVSKYIILHDTTTFGFKDEINHETKSDIVKDLPTDKEGLVKAVMDFLISPQGFDWVIHESYNNNNGLTILKKIPR
jgi:hypothetical protein